MVNSLLQNLGTSLPIIDVPPPVGPLNVPPTYLSLMGSIQFNLRLMESTVFSYSLRTGGTFPFSWGTELLSSTSVQAQAMITVNGVIDVTAAVANEKIIIDKLYLLGVRFLRLQIGYPVMVPTYNNGQYSVGNYTDLLSYYTQIVAYIKGKGIKIGIKMDPTFPPTGYSINYGGLTLSQFTTEVTAMAATLVTAFQPDYAIFIVEPDTVTTNLLAGGADSSVSAINTPSGYTTLITAYKDAVTKGSSKIGAGVGTWLSTDFVDAVTAVSGLDFLAMHIYPLNSGVTTTLTYCVTTSRTHGLPLLIDEAWIYKSKQNEGLNAFDVFARDVYTFWRPYDLEFVTMLDRLAKTQDVLAVSLFWGERYWFQTLDWQSAYEALDYTERINLITPGFALHISQYQGGIDDQNLSYLGQGMYTRFNP